MAKRVIELQPPLGGLDRRFAYARQRPFTSVDEQNVRAEETYEGRAREGSRPGLLKAFDEQLTGTVTGTVVGTPVKDNGTSTITATTGVFSSAVVGKSFVFVGGGTYTIASVTSSTVLVVTGDASGEDADDTFTIASVPGPIWMLGQVREITAAGGKFWEDDFVGAASSAWEAAGWKSDGLPEFYQSYAINQYENSKVNTGGVRAALSDFDAGAEYTISMEIVPYANGRDYNTTYEIFARLDDVNPDATQDGIRVWVTDPGGLWFGGNGTIGLEHYEAGVLTDSETLEFSLAGSGWREVQKLAVKIEADDTVTVYHNGVQKIQQTITHDTGARIGMGMATQENPGSMARVDWFKIQYEPIGGIENNRNRVIAGIRPSVTGRALYRELNTSALVEVAGGTMQIMPKGVVQPVEFLGKLYWTTTGDSGSIQEYDPVADVINPITATGGSVPTKCPAIGVFQSRLLVAGDDDDPHVWYMCKFGDVTDWNYGASVTDVGRAVAGTSTDQTRIGQPILAVASISDDYLIFGCISSLWLLRGNPAMGGIISPLSKEIGIIQNMAWCGLPDGGIAFMSRDGVYSVPPGGGALPQSISREKLPRELLDLDTTTNAILMAYDPRARGIHIAVTPLETATGIYYFLNLQTGGFHPVTLQSDHEPLSMMTYHADAPSQAGVLYGCRDGYVRIFSNAANSDDGSSITSYVLMGPLSLGGDGTREGAIDDMYAVLDDDSGDAVISVLVGDDAESASKATAITSRTISAGYSNRLAVRARGAAAFVKIGDSSGSQWAIDRLTLVTQRAGKHRG